MNSSSASAGPQRQTKTMPSAACTTPNTIHGMQRPPWWVGAYEANRDDGYHNAPFFSSEFFGRFGPRQLWRG